MNKTAIIILNYNNASDTINCIESVCLYEATDIIKIVVVDNCSNNSTIKDIDDYITLKFSNSLILYEAEIEEVNILPFITHLKLASNYGYARGNNFGLSLIYNDCEIERVMILNNDVILVEEILSKIIYNLETLNKAAIVSPLLINKEGKIDYNCARLVTSSMELLIQHTFLAQKIKFFKRQLDKRFILKNTNRRNGVLEIQLPSGSCMLMMKSFINNIHGFDPNTFLYLEEDILYEKIKKNEYKNYLNLDVKVIHLGASTTEKSNSVFVLKATSKSVIYFMTNYLYSPFYIVFIMKLILIIRILKEKIRNKYFK